MKKWILIGVFGIIGLVVLLAAVGWFVFSRPVDPNSAVGRGYAEGFKSSFVDSCLGQVNAVAGADEAMRQKFKAACQCGAEASYQEIKDIPVTEQYSHLQEPAMQQKMSTIMGNCIQSVGLQ
jgi:hypothetical protein